MKGAPCVTLSLGLLLSALLFAFLCVLVLFGSCFIAYVVVLFDSQQANLGAFRGVYLYPPVGICPPIFAACLNFSAATSPRVWHEGSLLGGSLFRSMSCQMHMLSSDCRLWFARDRRAPQDTVRNAGMNPRVPLKETTSWMVYKGHSNSHSLPIAPAMVFLCEQKDNVSSHHFRCEAAFL